MTNATHPTGRNLGGPFNRGVKSSVAGFGQAILLGVVLANLPGLHANLSAEKAGDSPHPLLANRDALTGVKVLPRGVQPREFIPPGAKSMTWELEEYPNPGDPTDMLKIEYAIEVTHIRFNHSLNNIDNGMSIRWNHDLKLDHDHFLKEGEYMPLDSPVGGPSLPDHGRNNPVLYKAGISPAVEVRIKLLRAKTSIPYQLENPNNRMKIKIRAENAFAGCDYLGLMEREVEFDLDPVTGDFVSKELGSGSTYVRFELKGVQGAPGQLPDEFGDHIARYRFFAREFKVWTPTTSSWTDTGEPEVEFDQTSRIDIYTVLGEPGTPWGWWSDFLQEPWVSA
jgi:hypothetical protein